MDFEPIKRREDFDKLRASGVRRSGRCVKVVVVLDCSVSVKLAVAVSRRFGNAVTRNRLKRLVRAAVRKMDGLPGGLYLVMPARIGRVVTLADIVDDLSRLFGGVTKV
jgi:ribonuclease P protein component